MTSRPRTSRHQHTARMMLGLWLAFSLLLTCQPCNSLAQALAGAEQVHPDCVQHADADCCPHEGETAISCNLPDPALTASVFHDLSLSLPPVLHHAALALSPYSATLPRLLHNPIPPGKDPPFASQRLLI